MTIVHRVALPRGPQYWMDYFEWSMTEKDLPEFFLNNATFTQKVSMLEFLVQRELLKMQAAANYITYENAFAGVKALCGAYGITKEVLTQYGLE